MPLGLSFIAGLVTRMLKGLVGQSSLTTTPAIDCLATAVRRGFDSPAKIAFAELRTGLLSRVDVHTAFAAQVADIDVVADAVEYGDVKTRMEAFLSFMDS